MRGTTALLLFLAGQGATGASSGEERGRFRLSYFGKEAGVEEYRLESFDDGQVVLFSKARYEIEVQGKKQAFVADTVLTMDSTFAPRLYAAYHKSAADPREVKIEWKRGKAHVEGKRPIDTSAKLLLDSNVYAQLLPILRKHEPGGRKGKVFSPALGQDVELSIADRGEEELRGVRARKLEVTLGALVVTAHLDERKRLLRASCPLTGALAELEGFEGADPFRRPESVEESEVTYRSGTVALAGSVTRPRGGAACPAVLLLSDAGPHDRDGTPGKGDERCFDERHGREPLRGALYRSIAYALTEAGLLVLRADDRGCGRSEGDFAAARLTDLTADAAAALDFLRARPDVSGVSLIGHGEGGLIAAGMASRDESIRSVLLLGVPARPLDALLLESMERALRARGTREDVLAVLLDKERRLFEEIRRAPGDTLEIDERPTFVGWMRERFRLDPRDELAKVRTRVVLAHGGKDATVPPDEAERLRQARPEAELRRFDGLDHGFARPGGPVDPGFLRWLVEELAKDRK